MNEFIFCIACLSPRDMSDDGLVEKCEECGDEEYIRSDFYVPDGKPFYGYIEPTTHLTKLAVDLKPAAVVKVKSLVASNH